MAATRTKRGAARAERGEASRRRILQAAGQLFAEHGFGGASVDEIAGRAGVNKAMLYYYVGGKDELFTAVLVSYIEGLRQELRRAASGAGDSRDRLRRMVEAVLGVFRKDPTVPAILIREVAAGGRALPDAVLSKVGEVIRVTQDVVEEGRARGELRDVHPLLVHVLIVGTSALLVNALPLRARLDPRELPPLPPALAAGHLARELSEILLSGVLAKDKKSPGGRP